MTKGLQQTFFQRQTHNQQVYEKISLIIEVITHQRNASENHNNIPIYTNQDSYYKKKDKLYWWGGEEKVTIAYCWRECKMVQPLWKTLQRFLKKLKAKTTNKQVFPLLDIYVKK